MVELHMNGHSGAAPLARHACEKGDDNSKAAGQ